MCSTTDILTRCRNCLNVCKKHGPSPLIPLPAPFTSSGATARGEGRERGHSNSNVSGSLKQGAFAAGRSGCSFVVLFLAASSPVLAHDPGLSALALRVDKSELIATLTLARADAEALVPLEANRDGRVRQEEFEKSR